MPRVVNTQYQQYINSPEWRKKRQERLDHDNRCCRRCSRDEQLEVHHLTYVRLGNEQLDDLLTLCAPCHAREHDRDPSLPGIGGLTQRQITERGEAKYWLERWQQVVEKAAAADRAIRDLRSIVRDDGAEWMFQDIEQMLTIIMRDCAGRWGSVWDFDPHSVVPLGTAA